MILEFDLIEFLIDRKVYYLKQEIIGFSYINDKVTYFNKIINDQLEHVCTGYFFNNEYLNLTNQVLARQTKISKKEILIKSTSTDEDFFIEFNDDHFAVDIVKYRTIKKDYTLEIINNLGIVINNTIPVNKFFLPFNF